MWYDKPYYDDVLALMVYNIHMCLAATIYVNKNCVKNISFFDFSKRDMVLPKRIPCKWYLKNVNIFSK